MTKFEELQKLNLEQTVEWLSKCYNLIDAPWDRWFSETYCKKCEAIHAFVPEFKRDVSCAFCELNKKCKYFTELGHVPNNKDVIKLWLESEAES